RIDDQSDQSDQSDRSDLSDESGLQREVYQRLISEPGPQNPGVADAKAGDIAAKFDVAVGDVAPFKVGHPRRPHRTDPHQQSIVAKFGSIFVSGGVFQIDLVGIDVVFPRSIQPYVRLTHIPQVVADTGLGESRSDLPTVVGAPD